MSVCPTLDKSPRTPTVDILVTLLGYYCPLGQVVHIAIYYSLVLLTPASILLLTDDPSTTKRANNDNRLSCPPPNTMVNFEWDPDHVPIAKLALHGAQILFAFTLWCMEIAVFNAKGASVVGDNGWTFAVVSA